MTDSQMGITLRQRGIGIVAAALLVQLIGVFVVVIADDWKLFGISLVVSAGASLLSFAQVRNHTGASGAAGLVTLLIAVVEAWGYSSSWSGAFIVAAGVALLLYGNKQLAAGIAS
jgi:hypothetical protein